MWREWIGLLAAGATQLFCKKPPKLTGIWHGDSTAIEFFGPREELEAG